MPTKTKQEKKYTLTEIRAGMARMRADQRSKVKLMREKGKDTNEIECCIKCGAWVASVLAKYLLLVLTFTAMAQEAVPGEFIVRFKPEAAQMRMSFSAQGLSGGALGAGYTLIRGVHSDMVKKTIESMSEHVEPNYIYRAIRTPNDPDFTQLWGMGKIRAPEAWDIQTGSSFLVTDKKTKKTSAQPLVAVIDTGVDYTHPDLKQNVTEKGFNALTGKEDAMDDQGHGTHVAGTIGAVGNNGLGVVGVNWSVGILPEKFLGADGSGTTAGAIAAIGHAIGRGVRVMNNSWGGAGYSKALEDVIAIACQKGVVFVAAAGNGGMDGLGDNNDTTPSYPANYKLPCVVSVAASDDQDRLTRFSNFGGKSVHVAAPGLNILSTVPGGKYAVASGTSMATPHVAGLFALVFAANPSLTADEAIRIVESNTKPISRTFWEKVTGRAKIIFGRIDARSAVEAAMIRGKK